MEDLLDVASDELLPGLQPAEHLINDLIWCCRQLDQRGGLNAQIRNAVVPATEALVIPDVVSRRFRRHLTFSGNPLLEAAGYQCLGPLEDLAEFEDLDVGLPGNDRDGRSAFAQCFLLCDRNVAVVERLGVAS